MFNLERYTNVLKKNSLYEFLVSIKEDNKKYYCSFQWESIEYIVRVIKSNITYSLTFDNKTIVIKRKKDLEEKIREILIEKKFKSLDTIEWLKFQSNYLFLNDFPQDSFKTNLEKTSSLLWYPNISSFFKLSPSEFIKWKSIFKNSVLASGCDYFWYYPEIVFDKDDNFTKLWLSEREANQNRVVWDLKIGVYTPFFLEAIIKDINTKIGWDKIDLITATPDSWTSTDRNKTLLKFVFEMWKVTWKEVYLPLLSEKWKMMKKQKKCTSVEERVQNRKDSYLFIDAPKQKVILFFDDVLSHWSTYYEFWSNLIKDENIILPYFIWVSEK